MSPINMKALKLLIQACSEHSRDSDRSSELFSAAMQCDDSSELLRLLEKQLSVNSNDIESLSEAASKASKRLRKTPKKQVRTFY